MRSLAELGEIDRGQRLGDFAQLARLLMLSRGIPANALGMARGRASQRVQEILKAPVPPGGAYGAGSWGEATSPAEARLVLSAFSDSLRHSSAFAAAVAANLLWRVPLTSTVGLVASGASDASVVGPANAAPVRKLDISGLTVERQRASGLIVLTSEFLRESPSEAESIISRELRAAVGAGIDAAFVAALLSGVTAHISSADPITDARTLMEDVGLTPMSRPFWICGVNAAIRMATTHTDGTRHAPDVGPLGGSFMGFPLYVSPGVDTDTLVLVDGARVAGNLGEAEVGLSRHSLVAMDDAPTGGMSGSPATLTGLDTTNLVSMFQENCAALKATQFFGITRLRVGAVASVFTGGSP
jgi:hypothetical protein